LKKRRQPGADQANPSESSVFSPERVTKREKADHRKEKEKDTLFLQAPKFVEAGAAFWIVHKTGFPKKSSVSPC